MVVSLQLYTVREETAKDFAGALEKVAEIGYSAVEFAGYGEIGAAQMKQLLDRLGLKVSGSHVALQRLKENLDEEIAYNLEIGNRYIVCPWAKYDGKADYLEMAALLGKIGAKCREKGLQLCYHNHAFEFGVFDGKYGLDLLYENSDSELLKAEIDTYWVKHAGADPVEYIRKYNGRCPLIHLKDMDVSGGEKTFTEIGNGIIDIKSIIAAAKQCGTEWFVVEQDKCNRPSLESARISFENLKKMNML